MRVSLYEKRNKEIRSQFPKQLLDASASKEENFLVAELSFSKTGGSSRTDSSALLDETGAKGSQAFSFLCLLLVLRGISLIQKCGWFSAKEKEVLSLMHCRHLELTLDFVYFFRLLRVQTSKS